VGKHEQKLVYLYVKHCFHRTDLHESQNYGNYYGHQYRILSKSGEKLDLQKRVKFQLRHYVKFAVPGNDFEETKSC
jgi:hypothetical protein